MADDTKLDGIINNPLFHQDRIWAKQQIKLLFKEVVNDDNLPQEEINYLITKVEAL